MHPQGEEVTAYIGLGANLGERKKNLLAASEKIAALTGIRAGRAASLYESEPVGFEEQGKFLNSVLEIFTVLAPGELLAALKEIEAGLKRERLLRWGPRTIDLDILFYGEEIIREHGLIIPHQRLHERAFVLVPLAEIAPHLVHPLTGKTVREHLCELGETKGVRKFYE